MTMSGTTTHGELDRQVRTLHELGYPTRRCTCSSTSTPERTR